MAKKYFISGIGTDVGKTIVSAVLAEALQADYWKPVQAGDLHFGDTDKVRTLISNDKSVLHPERYRLNTPASPHYAAELDDIAISLSDFYLPQTERTLIVEGAGGLMVPLNSKETVIDLIAFLQIPLVLVSKNYLGSINHTMLSIEVLFKRNIEIAGIVFNGKTNQASETWILNNSGLKCLARIDEANNNIDSEWIKAEAKKNISIIELMT